MDYKTLYQCQNEEVKERYLLIMERVGEILSEETTKEPFNRYFQKTAEFIQMMYQVEQQISQGIFFTQSLEELKLWNNRIYHDIYPKNYEKSYANPTYAVKMLGEEFGSLLCMLYAKIRNMTGYAAENAVYEMTIFAELFVEIYNCFEDEQGTSAEEVKNIIYWFFHDYSEVFAEKAISRQVNPEDDFFTEIVTKADFKDYRYLYRYGCPIGENEIKCAEFLNTLSAEKIQKMADTYTEGYRIGFEVTRKDLSKKSTVDIYYPIGFERVVRAAIGNFEKMGLQPVIRRGNGRFGVSFVSPNEQYDFDHKMDDGIYLDKAYIERWLECMRDSFEARKELAAGYAGPAVIEVFGQEPFTPENKKESIEYTQKQQKLNVYFSNMSSQLINRYIKGEERSFTIIAYPIPAIGEDFEEIFEKTVELNNLDYMLYRDMQQKIIDLLDKGEYVHIKGKGENRTDLIIALQSLKNPEKETNFENCVADVNIPVGEVFTSPKLAGTNGILHITQVYLNQLKYIDLELRFQDGMVVEYSCANFKTQEENQKFIKENLLFYHDTLPMGEFAIGTNTTAYKMARDYQIAEKLPILIAEKTGPHFAVGDTCYSWAEDTAVFNPDGKEIIARDNEVSLLRKEDPQKAYYNCHTDITIPYDELDSITVKGKHGQEYKIIENGKFVVEGTDILNVPLE